MPGKPIPLAARFWNKVRIGSPDSCWEWIAAKDPRGYGRVGAQKPARGVRLAHRVAYELTLGKVPDGFFVCHSCDNASCCNPKHLFVGTCADNNRDMYRKNRDSNQNERATTCKRGHAFDTANTYLDARGHRACRACHAAHKARYDALKKVRHVE